MGVGGEYNRILQAEVLTESWHGTHKGPVSGCCPHDGQCFPRKRTRLSKPPAKEGKTLLSHMSPNMRLNRGCTGLGSSSDQGLQMREPWLGVTAQQALGCLPGRDVPAQGSGASLIPKVSPSSLWVHISHILLKDSLHGCINWKRNQISPSSKQTIIITTRGVIIGVMTALVTTVLVALIISCCNFNIVLVV